MTRTATVPAGTPRSSATVARAILGATARVRNAYSTVEVIPSIIPDWRPTPAATLNKVARTAEARQATVAGENDVLPIVYGGPVRLGPKVTAVVPYGGSLVLRCEWCVGEVDAVVTAYLNDAALPSSVTATHYTGTSSQTANATLVAAFAAQGQTYADTLPGICYSVFVVPAAASAGFPRFTADVRGLKVATTSGGTPAYSDNAAYAVADFIESTTRGMGRSVDWATVPAVASACDALVGSEKKRLLALSLDTPQQVEDWLAVLCDYAGCRAIPEGDVYRLVPDTTGSSVKSFDESNIVAGTLVLESRPLRDSPTVVEVIYTDASGVRARDASAIAYASGVLAGSTPRRASKIRRPGTRRYSEAYRVAVERLNAATLCDLTATFHAFDEGLELQVGDIIDITHSIGLVAKEFRVGKIEPLAPGRWSIVATEYDAAVYSSEVATGPSVVDTPLSSPADPPAMSAITAAEQTYQLESGLFATRIALSWAASTWPHVRQFRVLVRAASTLAHVGYAERGDTSYVTPPLQEGITYTVEVSIVSTVGAAGAVASTLITLAGKSIAPGDVATISGFEVGGRVFLNWDRADNPTNPGTPDPDVWRYEVRRGATTDAWDDASVLDLVDGLRLVDEGAPAGTWRYQVKAVDSVGQYSTTAATVDITVSTDAASFLVDAYDQTSPTLTNMASFTLAPTDPKTYYVTEDGVAWGTKFSSSLSTYTNPLASYHSSLTSTWLGESEDFGSLLGGQWTGTADVAAVSGSIASYFGHSTDGSSWTYLSGLSQKVNARFARLKHEATTTSTLLVTAPTQNIRLDAIPREEVGTGTSSASGATTITLDNEYVATKKLTITPEGNSARMGIYDNIVLGSPSTFDVYVFNDAGVKIASPFRYAWQGV